MSEVTSKNKFYKFENISKTLTKDNVAESTKDKVSELEENKITKLNDDEDIKPSQVFRLTIYNDIKVENVYLNIVYNYEGLASTIFSPVKLRAKMRREENCDETNNDDSNNNYDEIGEKNFNKAGDKNCGKAEINCDGKNCDGKNCGKAEINCDGKNCDGKNYGKAATNSENIKGNSWIYNAKDLIRDLKLGDRMVTIQPVLEVSDCLLSLEENLYFLPASGREDKPPCDGKTLIVISIIMVLICVLFW